MRTATGTLHWTPPQTYFGLLVIITMDIIMILVVIVILVVVIIIIGDQK